MLLTVFLLYPDRVALATDFDFGNFTQAKNKKIMSATCINILLVSVALLYWYNRFHNFARYYIKS